MEALIIALLPVIETIIEDTPAAIALWGQIKTMISQGTDPTTAQWQALVAAMAASHAKVQTTG